MTAAPFVRARATAFVAASSILLASSCAPVLGGLDEGTPRDGGSQSASRLLTDAATTASPPACAPWLEGFAHRFRVDVASEAKLEGHSLSFSFNSRKLVASRKLRPDGADLRITRTDGVTVIPHWVEYGIGGEATLAWTKLDLDAGPNAFFVYYGNAAAPDTSSLEDTFVSGVIANGQFDHGSAPWSAFGPTIGGVANMLIRDREAHVDLALEGFSGTDSAALCQPLTFPPGARYRVVFDLMMQDAGNAMFRIWNGGLDAREIWRSVQSVAGLQRGLRTEAIDPGATRLCIGGSLVQAEGGHYLNGAFSNLRVARYAETEPLAGIAGTEESPCAADAVR